jgi:hypothetical protein
MNDSTMHPDSDDSRLDDALADIGHPAPGMGFADRVLSRTRHPLPRRLVRIRDWFRQATSGVRGWVLLTIISITTLGTWSVAGSVAWRERDVIARGADIAAAEAVVPAVQAARGWREIVVDRLFDWLPLSIPALKFFLMLYAAVSLVCVIGLWWLMRTPRAAEVHNA